jgi:hypothetical protein
MNENTINNIRHYVNTVKHWSLAGSGLFSYGKAHIVKTKGMSTALCGAMVYSENQVRWRDLCLACEKKVTRMMQADEEIKDDKINSTQSVG